MGVKIGRYTYELSDRKNKKLKTIVKGGKEVHFGDKRFQHFFDKTGLLDKKLNHGDEDRRKNYLTRSKPLGNDPTSSNYHARKILW